MESEERTAKKRKLSHDGDVHPKVSIDLPETEQQPIEPADLQSGESTQPFAPSAVSTSQSILDVSLNNFPESNESTNLAVATNVEDSTPLTQSYGVHDDEPLKTEASRPGEIAPPVDTSATAPDPSLSKNQQKKLRKQQEWESKRDERKQIRKEKQAAKRERQKAARRADPPESEPSTGNNPNPRPQPQPQNPKATQLPVTILIDCAFDDLMRDHERTSLASQITRCYSDTRKARFRPHLAIGAFTGQLRERYDRVLSHYRGWRGVRFLEDDFVAAAAQARTWMRDAARGGTLAGSFASLTGTPSAEGDEDDAETLHARHRERLEADAEVVYLTSEADETLTALRPYSTYIVGGLVDKNREKGLCFRRAAARGVRTARLPIGEFMEMQSRKVLATNHVVEIMLKWLECGDWGEAFVSVIPKRKGGKLKGAAEEGEEKDVADEEEDAEGGMSAAETDRVENGEGSAGAPQRK